MRELKFRGWNPRTNEMYYQVFVGQKPIDDLDKFFKETSEDGFVWMQCTGLKDKNGKEIYEGDIILGDQFVEWVDKDAARFDQEYCCYGIQNGKYNLVAYSDGEDFIVIGNIYENPELLESN